ncbi:MAG: hypothetical protein ABEI52_08235, partial [Halobacteriaceae archaeon]
TEYNGLWDLNIRLVSVHDDPDPGTEIDVIEKVQEVLEETTYKNQVTVKTTSSQSIQNPTEDGTDTLGVNDETTLSRVQNFEHRYKEPGFVRSICRPNIPMTTAEFAQMFMVPSTEIDIIDRVADERLPEEVPNTQPSISEEIVLQAEPKPIRSTSADSVHENSDNDPTEK